jgi:hypothetical protein
MRLEAPISVPLLWKRRVDVGARIREQVRALDLQLDRQEIVMGMAGSGAEAAPRTPYRQIEARPPEDIMAESRVGGSLQPLERISRRRKLDEAARFGSEARDRSEEVLETAFAAIRGNVSGRGRNGTVAGQGLRHRLFGEIARPLREIGL